MKNYLKQRRDRLSKIFTDPVILFSGKAPARNFAANKYPFRANSHFLYFAGMPLEKAAIKLENGNLELFIDNPRPSSTLWHGKMPDRDEIALKIGADAAYPLSELGDRSRDAVTLSAQLADCQDKDTKINQDPKIAAELAKAIVSLRLTHDEAAIQEIRQAVAVSVEAHQAGIKATPKAKIEAEVRAAIEGVILAANLTTAYNSIVTVSGEVLHNERYHRSLQNGDLLLADVGAETVNGWAADLTRTWPVNGKYSSTQRDIYDLVLAAHDRCIAKMKPKVEYREIHLLACQVIAEGLVELGILKGKPEDLVEQDAHALFFPHGIGHILGLDVHDMEDLGDLAGYESGRKRSDRFGLGYLRLDRPLKKDMVVTIEPGFYQVPAILNNKEMRAKYENLVNWERLKSFNDVRGIRIEDDILVTETGTEILSAKLTNRADEIEKMMLEID
ncbi:MAG: aminopeptidase P family protein [Prochloraceae cyanobacterium]|nr:aminopeptidase P family protein [Prochloraceae cyanobacterium]